VLKQVCYLVWKHENRPHASKKLKIKGGFRMGFFKKLRYSVTEVNMYPQMISQGVGKAFKYLLLFTLIFGTISSMIIGYQLNKDIGNFISQLEKDLPEFTFEKSKLHVEGAMPITYTELDENTVIIIDTTGGTTPDILEEYESAALFLEDQAIIKRNAVETRVISFAEFADISFDKEDVMNLLPYLKWFSLIAGIVVWIVFFIGKLISAFILSIISLIISKIRNVDLSFGHLYSLSVYSLTLPILLDIVFNLFHFDLPNLIYYAIAIIYAWLVIDRTKKQLTVVTTD
jgi:maltodextrin utilization protein YvdJ